MDSSAGGSGTWCFIIAAPIMAPRVSDQASSPAPGPGAGSVLPAQVWPRGTRINEAGHIEVGGCDLVEVAAEFGTPAYVYAEDDIRSRAREFLAAFRSRTDRFEVTYA